MQKPMTQYLTYVKTLQRDNQAIGGKICFGVPRDKNKDVMQLILTAEQLFKNDKLIKLVGIDANKNRMHWNRQMLGNDMKYKYKLRGIDLSICDVDIMNHANSEFVTSTISSQFRLSKAEFRWNRSFNENTMTFSNQINIESKRKIKVFVDNQDQYAFNLSINGLQTSIKAYLHEMNRNKNSNNDKRGQINNVPVKTTFIKKIEEEQQRIKFMQMQRDEAVEEMMKRFSDYNPEWDEIKSALDVSNWNLNQATQLIQSMYCESTQQRTNSACHHQEQSGVTGAKN